MVFAKNSDDPIPEEPKGVGNIPLLLSLVPFVLFGLMYFIVPEYGARTFREIVRAVGLFVALGWAAFGTYLVSESSTVGRAVLALLACALPASYLIVVAPGG